MNEKLLASLRVRFETKPTSELREVVREQNSGDWSEEAIAVAREILAKRPDEEEEAVKPAPPPLPSPVLLAEREAGLRRHLRWAGMAYYGVAAIPIMGALAVMSPTMEARNVMMMFGFAFAISAILYFAGRSMHRPGRVAHAYAVGVSAFMLLFFPLGTILGAYALWALISGSDLFLRPASLNPKYEAVREPDQ